MQPLKIARLNRVLEVEPLSGPGFIMTFSRYTGRYTVTGTQELELSLMVTQTDLIQMWELIDALTQPDVLHPVYRDIKISPFGDDGKYWLHVKWEGWHADEIEEKLLNTADPDLKELYEVLENFKQRAEQIQQRIADPHPMDDNTKVEIARKVARLLSDCVNELLPESPWTARGLVGAPFRKLTLGRFNANQSISIRLSPSEARKLARVVEACCGFHM